MWSVAFVTTSAHAMAQIPRPVTVTVGSTIAGPAGAIADLIGVQQTPFTFNENFRNAWGEAAFNEIGFDVDDIAIQGEQGHSDPTTGHITLALQQPSIGFTLTASGIHYDFSRFDARIRYLKDVLHVRRIGFGWFGGIPAMLDPASLHDATVMDAGTGTPVHYSGKSASSYAPFDYALWQRAYRDIVHHIAVDLHMPGAHYAAPWEAEICGWRGVWAHHYENCHNSKDAFGILDDYVEVYARVFQTIKSADPTAVVSGPLTATVDRALEGTLWSVPEFLDRLHRYIIAHPQERVGLDEVHFQNYLYPKNGTLRDILDVVTQALIDSHFCADRNSCHIPMTVTGWNADFLFNDPTNPFYQKGKASMRPLQRQAFLVGNIMREVAPQNGPRRLTRAFLWPLDTDFGEDSFSAVFYPDFFAYSDPPNGAVRQQAVADRYKAPAFASLKLLAEMKSDEFILRVESSDDHLWTLATSVNRGAILHLLLANYASTAATVLPRIGSLDLLNATAEMILQRVDAGHSSDGKGLESGQKRWIHVPPSGLLPEMTLPPYAVARLTLQIKPAAPSGLN